MEEYRPSFRSSAGDFRLEVVSGRSFGSVNQMYGANRIRSPDLAPVPPRRSDVTATSMPWSFNDPEMKRRKRIAKYKVYTIEGRMKASIRNGLRWRVYLETKTALASIISSPPTASNTSSGSSDPVSSAWRLGAEAYWLMPPREETEETEGESRTAASNVRLSKEDDGDIDGTDGEGDLSCRVNGRIDSTALFQSLLFFFGFLFSSFSLGLSWKMLSAALRRLNDLLRFFFLNPWGVGGAE
nr:Cell wall integrity and stress response component 1 like [Ipomoea batatas]GMD66717.1 Cell wall integrity and stress response component 1 like [Ipomoea batatas]GMD68890.1 Cell wall integrity and stress response component 1 like [Ipomoea batatas]GMD70945.1 Cell wall integrity and stress response component 1 like [Ipomoea batatas]